MAIFEGNLLGDGGARNAAGCGLGARLFAGEKCCCSVENAGRFNCDSANVGRGVASSRVGGLRSVDEFRTVEEDFVRVWDGTRALVVTELADGFRMWREVVRGGLDRSCLTGSVLAAVVFDIRFEEDLCNPLVVGFPVLTREGGGRIDPLSTSRLWW